MSKYPDSAPENQNKLKGALADEFLDFPIAPDFLSLPPMIDPKAMMDRLLETMPWRSNRPGEKERRLQDKVDVEFIL